MPLSEKLSLADSLGLVAKQGYQRLLVEGQVIRVDDVPAHFASDATQLTIVQDRCKLASDQRARFIEACEQAYHFGKGKLAVHALTSAVGNASLAIAEKLPFSSRLHCATCDLDYHDPSPALFSYNHPVGACPHCKGFGRIISIDYHLAVPDRSLSLAQGAVKPWRHGFSAECQDDLRKFCRLRKVPMNVPFEDLPSAQQTWVIDGDPGYGTDDAHQWPRAWYGVKGYFRWLESKSYKMHVRVLLSRYRAYTTCPECQGKRFQPETLLYRIPVNANVPPPAPVRRGKNGKSSDNGLVSHIKSEDLTLADLYALPIDGALRVIEQLVTEHSFAPNDPLTLVLEEVRARLRYLVEVGLGYLTLDRTTRSLSGGETERVNLTTCLGTRLVNTLFVLDEPSVGLHPRDTARLVHILERLRDTGNSVVVVEHEANVIRAADQIVDLGPGSGEAGGQIVFQGPMEAILHSDRSLTGQYLSGQRQIEIPPRRSVKVGPKRLNDHSSLIITGANRHNLKNLAVEIPLQRFVCLTGVSGSGKTTLVRDVLLPALESQLKCGLGERKASDRMDDHHEREDQETTLAPGTASAQAKVVGGDPLARVVLVDQSPLGKSPRSNPAVYTGAFDHIRELFAQTEMARQRGLKASAFSFNSAQGQCERCRGVGFEKVEMQFLSDVFIRCPACNGRRYREHILEVKVEGHWTSSLRAVSIADLLEATVDETIAFFSPMSDSRPAQRAVANLKLLQEVGLGYLRLGQPINTLSGGESQRLKLVSHLAESAVAAVPGPRAKSKSGKPEPPPPPAQRHTLFLFDEPTTGLHFHDVGVLLKVFQRLVDAGHSLLVIEHNLDVIKCADWIIDLGPEAGERGGQVVASGTPEDIAACDASHTGQFLRTVLPTPKSPRGSRREEAQISSKDDSVLAKNEPPYVGCYDSSDKTVSPTAGALREASTSSVSPRALPTVHRNSSITILGAREHNLKDLALDIPRDQFVVVTGVSGSGKSTLAFDLLFAEGQRRFLDSMNTYARQFVEQMARPDVDLIAGLPPTVSIEQRTTRGGGKSTVATVTEVYHFLRLLFARLGTQHCPDCQLPVEAQTRDQLARGLMAELKQRGALRLLAPVVRNRKGFHSDVADWAAKHGYAEIRADGKFYDTGKPFRLDRFREHDVEIAVGRLDSRGTRSGRQLIEEALKLGQGALFALDQRDKLSIHSTERACPRCSRSFAPLDPKMFSYNSAQGWCPRCRGFGEIFYMPEDVDRGERADAIEETWFRWMEDQREVCPECHGARLNPIARAVRLSPADSRLSLSKSRAGATIDDISQLAVEPAYDVFRCLKFKGRAAAIARDILPEIAERLKFLTDVGLGYLQLGRGVTTLSGGEAQRIRLAAQLGSNLSGVLYVLDEPTIGLHARDNEQLLGALAQLRSRGNSLVVVEHDEDTMRHADYIIDLGPGAGIHGGQLVAGGTLDELLRHDESVTGQCLRAQETKQYPTRGQRRPVNGGRSSRGSRPANSRGSSVNGTTRIRSRQPATQWLVFRKAAVHNLKNLTVQFPLNRLVLITGVSGSGKSTLVRECLLPALNEALKPRRSRAAATKGTLTGYEALKAVYEVDQSPIGRTPRSVPATYVGFFDEIRRLFAQTPEARLRGYGPGRFSFNSKQGRCPECEGAGIIKLEMNFLPPAFVRCERCGGSRFNRETLDIEYAGKTIAQVLEMSVEEALRFFSGIPKIRRALEALHDTGLDYLKLGQTSPTLSGGEAQRVKLVTHLLTGLKPQLELTDPNDPKQKRNLFILEEPTIGLHIADVRRLVEVLQRLVDAGHSVIVIEHNLDLIAEADWVIDLGPEGGDDGGRIVMAGTPEEIARHRPSHTGRFLRKMLKRRKR